MEAAINEAFIASVLARNKHEKTEIPRAFLTEWLNIIDRDLEGFAYPLSYITDWCAHGNRQFKGNLKVHITTTTDENGNLLYTKGKDYIEGKRSSTGESGRPTQDLLLTKDCFISVCLSYGSKKTRLLHTYYTRTEKLYREYMKSAIRENMQRNGQKEVLDSMTEDDSRVKVECKNGRCFATIPLPKEFGKEIDYKRIPCEKGVYAMYWEDDGGELLQIGESDCGPQARLSSHKVHGIKHKVVHWQPDLHPRSFEACVHRLLSEHLYDCDKTPQRRNRPCSHETFDYNQVQNNYLWAFDVVQRGLAWMEKEFHNGAKFKVIHRT